MIGRHQDLPLTKEGEEQAARLGKELVAAGLCPHIVFSSPLQRAWKTAELALRSGGMSVPISPHDALIELDYGAWSGLSTHEIEEKFGAAAFKDWEERGVPPANGGFFPTPDHIKMSLTSLFKQVEMSVPKENGVAWIVSSNGVLRFVPTLTCVSAPTAGHGFKMKTGAYSILAGEKSGRFEVFEWNKVP